MGEEGGKGLYMAREMSAATAALAIQKSKAVMLEPCTAVNAAVVTAAAAAAAAVAANAAAADAGYLGYLGLLTGRRRHHELQIHACSSVTRHTAVASRGTQQPLMQTPPPHINTRYSTGRTAQR
jgi:hypothetical protein